MEELSHYNKFNNLEPISVQLSELDRNSSIQGLLLKFVKDLQTEFPATITTVLKTGEKIASSLPDENCCRLCKVRKGKFNKNYLFYHFLGCYKISTTSNLFQRVNIIF